MNTTDVATTTIRLDPTGHYRDNGVQPHSLIDAMGVLPYWLIEGRLSREGYMEALKRQYDFWSGYMAEKGGESTIDEDGVYHYPEDPPFYPIAKLTDGDETCYIYRYSMVAVIDGEGDWKLARID